jgi:hypothetical protein
MIHSLHLKTNPSQLLCLKPRFQVSNLQWDHCTSSHIRHILGIDAGRSNLGSHQKLVRQLEGAVMQLVPGYNLLSLNLENYDPDQPVISLHTVGHVHCAAVKASYDTEIMALHIGSIPPTWQTEGRQESCRSCSGYQL